MKYRWWCNIRVKAKDGVVIFDRASRGEEESFFPFVPVVGMKLAFEEDGDAIEFTIKSVCWCFPQDCFWITLKDDSSLMDNSECQCTANGNCCVILAGSHRESWIKDGWTIHEEWKWLDLEGTDEPV